MEEKFDPTSLELEQREVLKTEDTFTAQSVTDEEAILGRDATKLFMSEEFNECLAVLRKLASQRPNDPRVLTNLAVCTYLSR